MYFVVQPRLVVPSCVSEIKVQLPIRIWMVLRDQMQFLTVRQYYLLGGPSLKIIVKVTWWERKGANGKTSVTKNEQMWKMLVGEIEKAGIIIPTKTRDYSLIY